MADVRLTATNPEDSSVVPVACDAAGRLLLEEPQVIEGPPGPPGEQGPPGQDGQDGQDGDPFSGNFAGDVTFGGSATYAGNVSSGAIDGNSDTAAGARLYSSGQVLIQKNAGSTDEIFLVYAGRTTIPTVSISADGTAEFTGSIVSGQSGFANDGVARTALNTNGSGANQWASVLIKGGPTNKSGTSALNVYDGGIQASNIVFGVNYDGSATFAGNKAGFTAEGYLWCTTRRGDTVILDATSQGVGVWQEYTPTSRIDEIRDKLDANGLDTGEMPADTQ